jgi:DNA-binding NarL/FixJ family response regulator
MSITVSLVEDKRRTREALFRLINGSPRMRCLAVYANAESAIRAVPHDPPDVLLVDLGLPKLTGCDCIQQLRPQLEKTRILVLTQHGDAEHLFPALIAGAQGYLLKHRPPGELLRGIAAAMHGITPISAEIAGCFADYFHQQGAAVAEFSKLSQREREILELLRRGSSNKEIAVRLNLSVFTIGDHLKSAYEKLHVRTRTAAVTKCFGR